MWAKTETYRCMGDILTTTRGSSNTFYSKPAERFYRLMIFIFFAVRVRENKLDIT